LDVESEVIDLRLKVKKLEEQCKEYHWVLERNQVVLEALFNDYRKRNSISSNEGVEVMFG